jgi:S1-C subfamily serine protease
MPGWILRSLSRVLLLVVLVCFRSSSARADLAYSDLDSATVRVFVFAGVDAVQAESASGTAYVVGMPRAGHGSGLLVSKDGLILTARHVVEDARFIAVQFPGEERPVPARLAYADKELDHAFLVVEGKRKAFVEIPTTGPKLTVRETVYVTGYPLDASRSHAQSQQGIISGVLADGSLQLGIALNPGNSGGPVVDAEEHLVGIAVARADPTAGAQGIGVAVPVEKILPSYKKLLGSKELLAAQKELAADRERQQAFADVLGTLLTAEDSDTAFRALAGKKDAPPASEALETALGNAWKASKSPSADLLTLYAAHRWNAGVVHIDRKGTGAAAITQARDLVKKAAGADAELAKESSFVSFVLEGRGPTDTTGVPSPEGSGGGGGTAGRTDSESDALDTLMESLEVHRQLPMLRIGPTFGFTAPFQIFGFGVSAKILLADLVNFDVRYQFGWHSGDTEMAIGHLAEGLAGIAVGNWKSTTTAKLVVDIEHQAFRSVFHYVPGTIPTVHVLVIEAGVVTGPINLTTETSTAGVFGPLQVKQTYVPEGGLRYTYFYHASSPYLASSARSMVELTAHLLGPPLGLPEGSLNADGKTIRSLPGFKTQVAWGSAPLSWGTSEIGVGYFPSADWIYFRLGWSYHFY